MPQALSTFSRLRARLSPHYERLAVAWHARRLKRTSRISLYADGDLLVVEDGGRRMHVPHIRRAEAFAEGITPRLEAVARKYLGATGYAPRDGDVVVDVGAGLGEFTVWCAATGARVIAFEPDPLAFACLAKNTSSFANVQIYPYALWKERTRLRLHGTVDTDQSSLIEDGRANFRNADVEAWTLDLLPFMVRTPVIDLMKVDGEGVEPEILSGAARTLVRTRIVTIDIGAVERRANLKTRVETMLRDLNFRSVDHGRSDSVLALNTLMVGPVSNRVLSRRYS